MRHLGKHGACIDNVYNINFKSLVGIIQDVFPTNPHSMVSISGRNLMYWLPEVGVSTRSTPQIHTSAYSRFHFDALGHPQIDISRANQYITVYRLSLMICKIHMKAKRVIFHSFVLICTIIADPKRAKRRLRRFASFGSASTAKHPRPQAQLSNIADDRKYPGNASWDAPRRTVLRRQYPECTSVFAYVWIMTRSRDPRRDFAFKKFPFK